MGVVFPGWIVLLMNLAPLEKISARVFTASSVIDELSLNSRRIGMFLSSSSCDFFW